MYPFQHDQQVFDAVPPAARLEKNLLESAAWMNCLDLAGGNALRKHAVVSGRVEPLPHLHLLFGLHAVDTAEAGSLAFEDSVHAVLLGNYTRGETRIRNQHPLRRRPQR